MKSENNNVANQKGLYFMYRPDSFFFFHSILHGILIFFSQSKTQTPSASQLQNPPTKKKACVYLTVFLFYFIFLFTKYH